MIARIAQTDAAVASAPAPFRPCALAAFWGRRKKIAEINETIETDVAPPEFAANGSHFLNMRRRGGISRAGRLYRRPCGTHGFAVASRSESIQALASS